MNQGNQTPRIFLSYSWKNEVAAEKIDGYFKAIGIPLERDIRDSKYRQSIKEFMKRIRDTDFVIMIISKKFLESENCMYEAMEMFDTPDFEKRFIPIVLKDANIFNSNGRLEYIKYWENKCEELNCGCKEIKDLNNIKDMVFEDLEHFQNVKQNIGKFLGKIKDINAKTFEEHIENNFKDILEAIGIDEKEILSELIEIQNIEDKDEQLARIEEFLFKYPNHQRGLFYKGLYFINNKMYKTSISLWKEYLIQNKSDFVAYSNIGVCFIELGKTDEALVHFDESLKYKSDYDLAWFNKGLLFYKDKNFNDSIKCCEKVIDINPNFHEAWNTKGLSLFALGNYFEAINCYNQAIDLQPKYHVAWNNMGWTLYSMNKYDEAIACYDKAIKLKPDFFHSWNNKGLALSKIPKLEEAIACYDEAIKIKPDFHEAWKSKGVVNGILKNYDNAITLFKEAIRIKPDDYEAWNNKGGTLFYLKSYNEAIVCFDEAIKIIPDNDNIWFNKALALARSKNKPEMLISLNKAIVLYENNKEKARTDEDFQEYWEDPDFIELTK